MARLQGSRQTGSASHFLCSDVRALSTMYVHQKSGFGCIQPDEGEDCFDDIAIPIP
ncbi:hypothetical protein SAMN05421753_10774 [Planctomicrobium piriforme]|uniref:Uncharacterized protein n=1 Tax=Planctomicrobium piriforme TaxID=1576369 RepID=A0A1I3GPG7_9PLAN|nr:hypothetical protein SAMN05421753_10774 [Planctomicrobium piriforme]